MGGELGADFAERHEIDGDALDDAYRIAISVQDDAQVAGLWKGRPDGRVLHGQAGRGALLAGEDQSGQFIRNPAFAAKAKGIGHCRSSGSPRASDRTNPAQQARTSLDPWAWLENERASVGLGESAVVQDVDAGHVIREGRQQSFHGDGNLLGGDPYLRRGMFSVSSARRCSTLTRRWPLAARVTLRTPG